MLESMRLGKPVIGTAYSGNMDFMSEDNSFPLPYRLTTLTRDYGPYMRGAEWADPDLDEAARLMRLITISRTRRGPAGERAQEQIIRAARSGRDRRRPAARSSRSAQRRHRPREPGMTRSTSRRARRRRSPRRWRGGSAAAQMRQALAEAQTALASAEENNRHCIASSIR